MRGYQNTKTIQVIESWKTETEFPALLFVSKALKGQLKPSEDEMAKIFLQETVKPEHY